MQSSEYKLPSRIVGRYAFRYGNFLLSVVLSLTLLSVEAMSWKLALANAAVILVALNLVIYGVVALTMTQKADHSEKTNSTTETERAVKAGTHS